MAIVIYSIRYILYDRVNELSHEKDRHNTRVNELERIITEYEVEKQHRIVEEQRSIQNKDIELAGMKNEMARRGERQVVYVFMC